ncbi:hypothetical protein HK097_008328 [Rhizophlyctis rosea]|uniref:Aquaporin n=1 Tax=Rhizophlyctis rosea TaxID=64517 RepID=A0AAD5SBZ0_9FUNG|nr:hypothetical protein HK097_008328 [Rhizophlyctis rosea]
MSGFAEIETDENELVPRDEINDAPGKFSWNPVDWFKEFYADFQTEGWKITEKRRVLLRAVFGEGLCTFLFLFIVEATSVNNSRQASPENLTLACVSTAFCSIALIYSFADVSGAHFNPAVTFATIVTGKVSLRKGLAFWAIQLFASIWSTIALYIVYPGPPTNYNTIAESVVVDVADDAKLLNAFFMEIILTFVLVYVIFATAFDTVDTGNNVKVKEGKGKGQQQDDSVGRSLTIYTTSGTTKAGFAPFAIGFTLGFLGLIGGSVSGGAYNPARVFGPALISGKWGHHWVYWIGDFIGAGLAGWAQHFFAHEAQQSSGASARSNKAARQEQEELRMKEIENRA